MNFRRVFLLLEVAALATAYTHSFKRGLRGSSTANPLLSDWSTQPFHTPPFAQIEPLHFPSAIEFGMKELIAELGTIANDPTAPDFENTVAAYDRAGPILRRIMTVYSTFERSLNTADMQAVQAKMSPIISRHESSKYQIPGLFARIEAVYETRNEGNLSPEQVRLVEKIYNEFARAGASLPADLQDELSEILAELSVLQVQFQQNILADEETWELILKKEDLVGCPDSLVGAARMAATERGKADDEYVITLSRSLVEPFLTFSDRRDLRKVAFEAWTRRGELDPKRNNLDIATQMLKLRKRVAEIHGFDSFADYQLQDRMAKTPENAMELLENVWDRAKVSANNERQVMEEFVAESGIELEGGIQDYDWRYIAEKVRKENYDFDESLLRPYLSLELIREALFDVTYKLFGLKFVKNDSIEKYHSDVETFEVYDTLEDGSEQLIAVFYHDNFARPFKRSGAWMSALRTQSKNLPFTADPIEGIPVVTNNNNFAKGGGSQTLLSYDDASVLFHEFGHALHGILSNSTYRLLAGTNVARDYVEFPSKLYEQWFDQREILKKYARHYETGEPVPDELLDRLAAAKSFQQGFRTVEYTSSALVDMALHQLTDYKDFDLADFERTELERLGMPHGIVMRHRPAHFGHLFAGGYAAGYYSYLWSEVLEADVFAAFVEAGDIFDPVTAERLRRFIFSSGDTQAPDELFRQFRGRDPDIDFMLKQKGLLP